MKTRLRIAGVLALAFGLSCKNAENLESLLLPPVRSDAPRVIASFPSALASSVSSERTLYVEFDRAMDTESVRDSFILTGTSPTPGRQRWESNRLIYDLDAPLVPGNAFSMSVQSAARSLEGAELGIDYIVHFTAGTRTDAPRVSSSVPARGSQGVDPLTTIRLVFSRSMNRASVESAFSISPSASGAFSWNSDSTELILTPYAPLTSGAVYTVTLSTGAKDPEGIALAELYSLDFQAGLDFVRPVVNGVYEQGVPAAMTDGMNGFEKDHSIEVRFSEPMDPLSLPLCLELVRLSDNTSVSGHTSIAALYDSLEFIPDAPLEPDASYRLTVRSSAKDAAGNNLAQDTVLNFRVSNAAGALNSSYMSVVSASKLSPGAVQALSLSENDLNILTVNPISSTMRLSIRFSHSLSRGSIPENISFLKVLGVSPGAGSILSIQFATTLLTDDTLLIDLTNLGTNNEYELRFFGARGEVLSTAAGSETPVWLEKDQAFFIRSTP